MLHLPYHIANLFIICNVGAPYSVWRILTNMKATFTVTFFYEDTAT